jgi:signal transduction histidine kinase
MSNNSPSEHPGGVGSRLLAGYQGNRPLTGYIALIAVLGVSLLFLYAGTSSLLSWTFLLWLIFSFAAEFLWLETPTGEATDSMASTFNVAVLFLFGNTLSLWIIGLSVLAATRLVQKKDWTHSLFGLGQMVVTAFAAGSVVRLLVGGPGRIEHLRTPAGAGALILASMVYYLVNTVLVSGAIALERRAPLLSTLRTNYGYRNAILSSAALLAWCPILLLSYLTLGLPVGYVVVVFFFLPLALVKKQNREYIELQRTTQALISSERMAAKGEMAAAVAHEMNNYLAVLSGRTQLLQRKVEKGGLSDLVKDGEILWTQVERLTRLARGLLDFSHRELKVTFFDLNVLCRELVEFLQPQNVFDKVKIELDLEEELGEVEGDAGQMHQVLLNLCRNSADAMKDAGTENGTVWVRTRTDGKKSYVRVEVEDNGPGVPVALRARIFEPGFTTKEYGHGFGLATTARIVENHHGRIWVEERPGGGARFIFMWPKGIGAERIPLAA